REPRPPSSAATGDRFAGYKCRPSRCFLGRVEKRAFRAASWRQRTTARPSSLTRSFQPKWPVHSSGMSGRKGVVHGEDRTTQKKGGAASNEADGRLLTDRKINREAHRGRAPSVARDVALTSSRGGQLRADVEYGPRRGIQVDDEPHRYILSVWLSHFTLSGAIKQKRGHTLVE